MVVYESSLKSLPPFIRGIRFPIPELDDINLIFSNIPCQVHTIYLNFLDIRDHNHARAIFSSIPKHIQYIAEFTEQELPDKSILGCIPKNAFFTIHFWDYLKARVSSMARLPQICFYWYR